MKSRQPKTATAAGPEKQLIKALKLLSYRPRSEGELRRRGLAAALPQLRAMDLIDDKKFASWWVDQRVRFNPRGNVALKAELFQKGIDRQIVESVMLSNDQEEKLARRLLSKKELDKPQAQRLLLSRGFSSGLVFRLTAEGK